MNDAMLIDRLVDGELDENARRRLLASLDDSPDGWRRCALAFLESQELKSGFEELLAHGGFQEASAVTPRTVSHSHPMRAPAEPRSSSHSRQFLALAASIAVAFFLGFIAHRNWQSDFSGTGARPDGAAATIEGNREFDGPSPHVVAKQPSGDWPENDDGAIGSNATDDPSYITLTGSGVSLRVPLVHASQLRGEASGGKDGDWDVVPPDVVRMLEQSGRRVERRRTYVPMTLEDGSQAVLPIEDLEITPVAKTP